MEIYTKIEVLKHNISKNSDISFPSTVKLIFEDCGMIINGNYIIITTTDEVSESGDVLNMDTIIKYKKYK